MEASTRAMRPLQPWPAASRYAKEDPDALEWSGHTATKRNSHRARPITMEAAISKPTGLHLWCRGALETSRLRLLWRGVLCPLSAALP
jgi:hypothetical protein